MKREAVSVSVSDHVYVYVMVAVLVFATATATAATEKSAVPLDVLTGRLGDIDSRLREVDGALKKRPGDISDAEQAARRLTDAEVLYTLRNYDAAATILFDVVDRYPKAAAYPDALFYLGDSLYHSHSRLAARRFFEKLADGFPGHPRQQEAMLRLVEIALYNPSDESMAQADKWLDRLAQVPRERQLPAVPYVRAKVAFLRQQDDKAIPALQAVPPPNPYYFQARYLLGAAHVRQGALDEAVRDFSFFATAAPRSDDDRRVAELAHLALGRIYYEQGQSTRSQEEYGLISQKSDLFGDALYESAWVAIKAKDYKRATRQLELLVLAQPDSLNIPEVKLLMGNLQIRTGDHAPATRWFHRTRDEFDPVRQQLEGLVSQNPDLPAYFREQVHKNLDRFDISVMVPKIAARYMKADADLGRYTGVAGDVSELRRALAEAETDLGRIEKVLAGPGRYRVDPQLASAREDLIGVAGELLGLRRQVADRMTEAVTMAASADELRRLSEYSRRRGEMEQDIGRVIATLGSRDKAEAARARVNEIDKKAAELKVHLEGLRQGRAAIEKYYQQTRKQQKIRADNFQRELADVTAQEVELSRQYEELRRDLQEAMSQAESEGQQVDTSERVMRDYAAAQHDEQDLMDQLRLRLTGTSRNRADMVWAAMERAFNLDRQAMELLTKVNGLLDAKIGEVQASLMIEKENLKRYGEALGSASNETEDLGGGILADVLTGTARRFHDLVVRADVGIIDVAWAQKQQHTEHISRILREQKREMKLLDDDFKAVLKE